MTDDISALDCAMIHAARLDLSAYLSMKERGMLKPGTYGAAVDYAASAARYLFGHSDSGYVLSRERICRRMGVDGKAFAQTLWRKYTDRQRDHLLDLMADAGVRLAI